MLTGLLGSSAGVAAAAAAAAQAGAALVQVIRNQTGKDFSLRTLVQVVRGQHVFVQLSWEVSTALRLFVLKGDVEIKLHLDRMKKMNLFGRF